MRLGVALDTAVPIGFCSHRFLRLYFPALEPWVAWSVSLPSCSCWFIFTQMWDHPLCQLPPCWVHQLWPYHESFPPGCPSPPLLPVWMNISLTPWFLDFHTVQFSDSSGYFLLLHLLLCFFWLCKEAKCIYPSWPEVL